MKGDYFLYFYIEDLAQLLMTLLRKVIFSELEHFAQLLSLLCSLKLNLFR